MLKAVFRTTSQPTLFRFKEHRPKNGLTLKVHLYQKGLKTEEVWPDKPASITIYPSDTVRQHGYWDRFIRNWNECAKSTDTYVARINTLEVPEELVIKYISFKKNSIQMFSKEGGYEITFKVISADSKNGPTNALLVSIRI